MQHPGVRFSAWVAADAEREAILHGGHHTGTTAAATPAAPKRTQKSSTKKLHALIARSRHGPTDVALMVPLCGEHHDLIHHRGWSLTIETDRTVTWTDPNGRPRAVPFVPLADLDQLTLFAEATARPSPAA